MCHDQCRVHLLFRNLSFSLSLFILFTSSPSLAQPQIIQTVTLREIVPQSHIKGRDGIWQIYISPGSPYPFGNLGGAHDVGEVCLPTSTPQGETGVFLSAGQGLGDMVAFTPGGSPFQLGQPDPSGKVELCNPRDTDDTWWFAYGDSLNISTLLAGRFFGNEDTLQEPTCDFISTPVEGVIFLERRSADRQVSDLACIDRDPHFPLRLGTLLICSFTNTWLDAAGNNLVPQLRTCERYLACTNTPFGEVVPPGQLCGQPTPAAGPPTLPPGPGGNPPPPPTPPPPVVQCSVDHGQGEDIPDKRLVELAQTSGTFQFDYNTYSIEDQIIVSYEGTVLFDTGCVGASGSEMLSYAGTSTQVLVEVIPDCAGGTDTQWDWTVHCPQ